MDRLRINFFLIDESTILNESTVEPPINKIGESEMGKTNIILYFLYCSLHVKAYNTFNLFHTFYFSVFFFERERV